MTACAAIEWDDPRTAAYYGAFDQRHDRYRKANRALAARAALEPGIAVLDVGAGLGGTAEAVLPHIGARGRIACFEPARAMRDAGRQRMHDERVSWLAELDVPDRSFDRVLCGAAIWQMLPLASTFETLARILRPGGALCFNIPSLYLGEPDEPGQGLDPCLLALPARLAVDRGPTGSAAEPAADDKAMPNAEQSSWSRERPGPKAEPLPDARGIESMLEGAGLGPERWHFRVRLTQAAYRDWLKIPVITNRLLKGLDPAERAGRVDLAWRGVDASSWKWEGWTGWTAWKAPAGS